MDAKDMYGKLAGFLTAENGLASYLACHWRAAMEYGRANRGKFWLLTILLSPLVMAVLAGVLVVACAFLAGFLVALPFWLLLKALWFVGLAARAFVAPFRLMFGGGKEREASPHETRLGDGTGFGLRMSGASLLEKSEMVFVAGLGLMMTLTIYGVMEFRAAVNPHTVRIAGAVEAVGAASAEYVELRGELPKSIADLIESECLAETEPSCSGFVFDADTATNTLVITCPVSWDGVTDELKEKYGDDMAVAEGGNQYGRTVHMCSFRVLGDGLMLPFGMARPAVRTAPDTTVSDGINRMRNAVAAGNADERRNRRRNR